MWLSLVWFWDEETGLVARLMELSCSLLPPGSPSDSLSRLSSGPCSWDLLCEGAGHSEYLPGALPMLTGASDLATHFSEGVVDPVGKDWGLVPWGLHLRCRGSLRGLLWKKHLSLDSLGGSWLRELCVLSCWIISSDLGHLDSHLSFLYSESFWFKWNIYFLVGMECCRDVWRPHSFSI